MVRVNGLESHTHSGESMQARLPIVALAIFSLLAALWGGLLRLGWQFPPLSPLLTGVHGPLIISGFLGTLISMERAVALQARWAYVAPLFSALGALVMISGFSPVLSGILISLGSLGMVGIFVVIVRRQPALFTYTMALGAVMWFVGNLVWLAGVSMIHIVLWWTGFLVLTVVGERLELSRLLRPSRLSERLYMTAVALVVLGSVTDLAEAIGYPEGSLRIGLRMTGAGLFGLALWLLRNDIARRTVRQTGLTRFIALCLLTGYFWLAVGGAIRLFSPDLYSMNVYDAMLHSVFLGFVMSMIFGHAPIILPAVLGRAMPYHPGFYVHFALLHASLALRIAGDYGAGSSIWQWGGLLNVVAVLIFLFATARVILSKAKSPFSRPLSTGSKVI